MSFSFKHIQQMSYTGASRMDVETCSDGSKVRGLLGEATLDQHRKKRSSTER